MNVPVDYFEEAMNRLYRRFLNVSQGTVLHPLSSTGQRAVQEQQTAANKAEQVQKKNRQNPNAKIDKTYRITDAWWSGFPNTLESKIREINERGGEFESVSLGPDSSYMFIFDKNSAWWSGIPAELENKIREVYQQGSRFKCVSLGSDASYMFLFNKNSAWWSGIPRAWKPRSKKYMSRTASWNSSHWGLIPVMC